MLYPGKIGKLGERLRSDRYSDFYFLKKSRNHLRKSPTTGHFRHFHLGKSRKIVGKKSESLKSQGPRMIMQNAFKVQF